MIAVLNNQSLPKKKSLSRFRLRPRRLLTIESLKALVIVASIAMMVLYLATSSLTLSLLLVERQAAPSAGPPATMMIARAQKPEWTGTAPKAGRYSEKRASFEDLADTLGIPSFSLYVEEVSFLPASNGRGPLE